MERLSDEGTRRFRQTSLWCEIRCYGDRATEGEHARPHTDGLTIEEATHELAFIATGMDGKPVPRQNGAPLRLAVPWKYGFKNIKSLVRFTFTDKQPVGYWEKIQGKEYGFWANVNPKVDHPRWTQSSERLLGSEKRVPTLLYNGYAEEVAGLYAGMEKKLGKRLFM